MNNDISTNNYVKHPGGARKLIITNEELQTSIDDYQSIKGTSKDFLYQYGSGSIDASNLSKKTTSVYSANEVSDSRELGLNALALEKVELSIGITTDSKEVSEVINKQVLVSVTDILKEFNLASSLPNSLKMYTQDVALESVNSIINQGAQQIIEQGGSAKELDDFLYSISQGVDKTVDELKAVFSDNIAVKNDDIMGLPTTATLRVWQQKDVNVEVVSQTFNITNSDGDEVEIKATYSNSKSEQTDDYSRTRLELNVDIRKGSLSQEEQKKFNQFLDDFAEVTNAILAGDADSANEAFNNIKAEDYGLKSIEKVNDNTYESYDNEATLHIYNEEMGHNAAGVVNGQFDGSHQDESLIKGGQFHGKARESVADLGAFDIKFANTHEVARGDNSTFILGTNNIFDSNKIDPIFGFSKDYGKDSDGTVMQDESGELFQYQYNSKDRDASGWQKIDKELVDLEGLQVKDYFNQFKLEILEETGQVFIKDASSNKVVTAETKLASVGNENYTDKFNSI